MTRSEILRQALSDIRTNRQKDADEALKNRQIAFERIPRLFTLENSGIEAGVRLARLAASHAEKEELDLQRKKMDSIEQEQTELLRGNGYPADFLQIRSVCPVCGDTGYTADGSLCGCVKRRMTAIRRTDLEKYAPLSSSRFDNFDLDLYPDTCGENEKISPRARMTGNFRYCLQYAENFGADCPSIFMTGNAGLGKTHLALAVAGAVLNAGTDVIYAGCQSVFSSLEAERYGGGAVLSDLLSVPLLILDDLGSEYVTPYAAGCLYRIVDTRLVRHLPTIYTSNLGSQRVVNARYTEKVGSRLFGSCDILYFAGNDLRLQASLKNK